MSLLQIIRHQAPEAMPDIAEDAMTRTVWGEARNQSDEGQAAVAYCILKRAGVASWWDSQHTDSWHVAHQAYQFSSWNPNDPNFPAMVKLDPDSAEYRKIFAVVEKVLSKQIPDPCISIGGATHYKVFGTSAEWDKSTEGKPSVRIGAHIFFNLGPSA